MFTRIIALAVDSSCKSAIKAFNDIIPSNFSRAELHTRNGDDVVLYKGRNIDWSESHYYVKQMLDMMAGYFDDVPPTCFEFMTVSSSGAVTEHTNPENGWLNVSLDVIVTV